MSPIKTGLTRILDLASQIESDIKSRELKPGDPYLTLSETSRLLRVGTTTANRALQLLAQRNVLSRVQRKGTFIKDLNGSDSEIALKRVYILVPRTHQRVQGLLHEGALLGLQGEVPDADLQIHFLPETETAAFADSIVVQSLLQRQKSGIVMMAASHEVQKIVSGSGVPSVISGSPYPAIKGVPWIDQDNPRIGRILGRYLLQKGCSHICILTCEVMRPGDHEVHEGVREVLGKAAPGPQHFHIRYLPFDETAVAHEVVDLTSRFHEKIGFICRRELFLEATAEALLAMNLPVERQPLLTMSDHFVAPHVSLPYAYITFPGHTAQSIGVVIGRLLREKASGRKPDPDHYIIPVDLVVPDS